jgi:hypothetical protein
MKASLDKQKIKGYIASCNIKIQLIKMESNSMENLLSKILCYICFSTTNKFHFNYQNTLIMFSTTSLNNLINEIY